MSTDPASIARDLAARLRRVREAHGAAYVSVRRTPGLERPTATPAAHAPPAAAAPAQQQVAPSRAAPAAKRPSVNVDAAQQQPAPSRAAPAAKRPSVDVKAALRQQAAEWSPATKLEYLRKKNLGDCKRCGLCQSRTNIVYGVGDPEARIMFVGEAPGADEDRTGEPFVGRAGQLLDRWLQQLGLARSSVYIANVLKCRPPNNRDPNPTEIQRCSPFLRAQIRAIEPRVIVGLGRHAGLLLSGRGDMSLRAMRGARLEYDASSPREQKRSRLVPLVVTYHPAYVLRQHGDGEHKATQMVMDDLQRALAWCQEG